MNPERQLRAFLEAVPDAFFAHDPLGRITDVNARACQLSGYSRKELLTMNILDLEQDFDLEKAQALWCDAQPGETFSFPGHHRRKDGSVYPVEVHVSVYREGEARFILGLVHDATRRFADEARRRRLTQLYQALSEVNQAIVRMDGVDRLYPLVCRVAVEFGGMNTAWIGELEPGNKCIRPVALHGTGQSQVTDLEVSIDPAVPEGRGPSGTAWRERRNVVVNNFVDHPMLAPWKGIATEHGWGSVGAFPILRGKLPVAVLVVYHEHAEAFDEEIVRLLDEMAGDISFALDNFDREQERRATLALLQENEARLRLTLEVTQIGVWDWEMRPDEWAASPIYFKMLGYDPDEAGQNREVWGERTHPDDREFVTAKMLEVRDRGLAGFDIEFRFRHADGSYRWINSIGRAVAFDEKGLASRMLGLQIDVTPGREREEALRLSEEKFSKVFSNLPNPLSITKLEDGTFIEVNQAWVDFTGYSREQAIGRNALELGVWGDPQDRIRLVEELKRSGRVTDFEATVNAVDHRAICLLSAETILIRDEPHIVLIVQDITEKRRYDTLIWKQANFGPSDGFAQPLHVLRPSRPGHQESPP